MKVIRIEDKPLMVSGETMVRMQRQGFLDLFLIQANAHVRDWHRQGRHGR